MCGIVSVFGAVTAPGEKAFKELLIIDQLRGAHSTGMAAISRASAVPKIVKVVGTPDVLAEMKAYDSAFAGINRAFIGHNRYATMGAITATNAHPFRYNGITGVHNGSLRVYNDLDGYGDFAVDSQVLYNHISLHGLGDAVSNFRGAAALVFWNENSREITLYRNAERPLFLVMSEDRRMAFVASEDWMIYGVLGRNKIPHMEAVEIPVDHSMTFSLPDNSHAEIGKPQLRHHAPKPTPTIVYGGTYGTQGNGGLYTPTTHPTHGRAEPSSLTPPRTTLSVVGGTESKKANGVQSAVNEISKNASNGNSLNEEHPLLGEVFRMFRFKGFINIRDYDHGLFELDEAGQEKVSAIASADAVTKMGIVAGDFITADVVGFKVGNDRVRHYTLGDRSMTLVEDHASDLEMINDHTGKPIELKAWLRRYGTCANCTADVEPSTMFSMDRDGNCFCEECTTNPILSDVLKV